MTTLGCRLDGVRVDWSGNLVLEGAQFEVDFEDLGFLPILGRSGAGKSSLLYVVSALKWPTAGTIEWTFPDDQVFSWGTDGLSRHEATRIRRSYFGFAFQDSTLLPQLRVAENLEYPLVLRDGQRSSSYRQERVEQVLRSVDLEPARYSRKFPHELSGGERQRVALGQAMIGDPYVLFADEPGGSLDPETRAGILKILKEWRNRAPSARGFVWITHNFDDLDALDSDMALRIGERRCQARDKSWMMRCQESLKILP